MKTLIPHLRPWIIQDDIEATTRALSERSVSNWHYAEVFSKALKEYSGFKVCRLYASGTLSLRGALLHLGLSQGSGIGIPSFTCRGVLNGVLTAGYKPFIIDCDDSGLMLGGIAKKAFLDGKIAASVAVHQFGLVNRSMEPLTGIMPVIEDCSHVLPRPYLKGSRIIFGSLEGTKLIGVGEGGYLLANQWFSTEKPVEAANIDLGNRLPDLTAALAICQLDRLAENIKIRGSIADKYKAAGSLRITDGERASWFRFLIQMDSLRPVNELVDKALGYGITLRRPIMPYPLHKYVDGFNNKCPSTERLWETTVSIPLYPDLTGSEIDSITSFLKAAFA